MTVAQLATAQGDNGGADIGILMGCEDAYYVDNLRVADAVDQTPTTSKA